MATKYAGTVNAPDFPEGLQWLNSDRPLDLKAFHGKGGIFKKCVNSQAVYPLSEQHGLEAQERR